MIDLLCGCQDDSDYLKRIFNNSSAYIVAVHIMHMRHEHYNWDEIWPIISNYDEMKIHINNIIKFDLIELIEQYRAFHLLEGFKSLQHNNNTICNIINKIKRIHNL